MNLYKKFVLPRMLRSAMSSEEIEKLRPGVIAQARGVVLEIGVGAGNNLPLYKNIEKVYALEPSKELMAMAQKQTYSVPVEFISAKAEKIPLSDHSIDTVVSTWTLCSIGNPAQSLREITRVLRPQGQFVFIDHGLSPKPVVRALQRVVTPFSKHFTGNCHLNRDIVKLITDAGFKIQKLEQFPEATTLLIYNNKGVAINYR